MRVYPLVFAKVEAVYWLPFVILVVAIGLGTFAGLLICANVDVSNFCFTEPRKDLLRSTIVALITAGVAVGLAAITDNPRAFLALLPVWYLTVKLCWLDFELPDLVIVGASTLVFLFVALFLALRLKMTA